VGLHGGAINEHLGRGVGATVEGNVRVAGKRVEEIDSHPLTSQRTWRL
jgi:hypothetical protein